MHKLFGMNSPRVLIGVVNRFKDLEIILNDRWYRIPVDHMPTTEFDYIAFYQTSALGEKGRMIEYYARVMEKTRAKRIELLPDEACHPRAGHGYYKFRLGRIKKLSKPIINKQSMRVTFGFTTVVKLNKFRTLASLYGTRPLEIIFNKLLTKNGIPFTPEHPIIKDHKLLYRLDFALFCKRGRINVECDIRKHHLGARRIKDRYRDRFMRRRGWKVLRFNEDEIMNRPKRCLKILFNEIKSLGGCLKR